ncbi:MAG: hypothetical protein H6718_24420 [Polyangiaceae bacterium]|nr:hypothetical protein [Myxococcales bacterium]MCB9588577.1 hypothetical protein [Polyangiaceae bacterium]
MTSASSTGSVARLTPKPVESVEPASNEHPATLTDPLNATRPFSATQQTYLPLPEGWRDAVPAKELQFMAGPAERGGVLPCEAPDPGFGVHEPKWIHVQPMGNFIVPKHLTLDEGGGFDLVVHFHGQRPARKELVRTGEDLVFLGVSLGIGKAYAPPFHDGKLFTQLITGVEKALSKRIGRPAHVRRMALSGWSRGFEAIGEVLTQPLGEKVDALILLDSFHGSRDLNARALRLAPFVAFGRAALVGKRFFFLSHSAIPTEDYASTTETIHWLVSELGGKPVPARRKDPLGLQLTDFYSAGDFHTRGYAGNGKLDHCAHFGVYPDAIRAVAERWRRTPTAPEKL